MGLHIGSVGSKDLLHTVDGQLFGDIDKLTAAVVALAGVALGVFVGELGTLGRHHGGRGVVLAGDQFDVVFLARVFSLNGCEQLGVGLLDENVAVEHGSPSRGESLRVDKGCPGERLNTRAASAWVARFPVVVPAADRCLERSGKGATSAADLSIGFMRLLAYRQLRTREV